MRALVQRVTRAEVRVAGQIVGRIDRGLLVLLGVAREDTTDVAQALAEKIVNLRAFPDDPGGEPSEAQGDERRDMNRSVLEVGGSVLCVSQFTLYGDCRKGRRPSYDRAAPPDTARSLYEAFLESMRRLLPGRVESGLFQAMMDVELVNDGPVTLLLDSDKVSY